MIKKLSLAMIAGMTLNASMAAAAPIAFTETTDAGALPGGAIFVGSTGPNDGGTISGSTGETDFEDLFRFSWDGGLFDADIAGFGSTNLDTMVFLFRDDATFIGGNFDTSAPGDLLTDITLDLVSADYLLGVSGRDHDPLNSSGDAFRSGNQGTLDNWFADITGPTGSYTITINQIDSNGGGNGTVPEPAPLALLALGLTALAWGRRKRRA